MLLSNKLIPDPIIFILSLFTTVVYDVSCLTIGIVNYNKCSAGVLSQPDWLITSASVSLGMMLLTTNWDSLKYITFFFNLCWAVVGLKLYFSVSSPCNVDFAILMFMKLIAVLFILLVAVLKARFGYRPLDHAELTEVKV